MRFADIVLDLAAVLSASRSVASKHTALRARQLDRYGKTSSISAQSAPPSHRPQAPVKRSVGSPDKHFPENEGSTRTADEASQAEEIRRKDRPEIAASPHTAPPPPIAREQVTLSQQSLGPGVRNLAEVVAGGGRRGVDTQSPAALLGKDKYISEQAPPAGTGIEGEKVPEGVNINVFQTPRGSKILKSLKASTERIPRDDEPLPILRQPPSAYEPSGIGSPTIDRPSAVTAPGFSGSKPDTEDPGKTVEKASTDPTVSPSDISAPVAARAALNIWNSLPSPVGDTPKTDTVGADTTAPVTPTYQLKESQVPATRLSRLWNYGGLAAGMLGGALSESISRGFGGGGTGSLMLSAANMERLVSKLSKMRGAALKMGQIMSFQDSKMLPEPIQEVLQRVQDRADYMPAWQRDRVLAENLGSEWRDMFDSFEEKPIAAASIGQVHRATLKSSGQPVAVKIQFPGVASSINSDLDNIAMLLAATKLLPKGLYLNKTIDNARTELGWECDYEREAECAERYRELLAGDEERDVFVVPKIYREASAKHVLTMEYMGGVGVTRIKSFTQEQRDWVGTQILRLCLREITEFRFMQTDPNWTNFLYNAATDRLELLDFGASREYPDRFVSLYVRLLRAASEGDRDGVRDLSRELGYLTGHESRAMDDAHVTSVLTLAEPFLGSAPEAYDFHDQTITERVRDLIPVMVRERLAPPPEETYSLHRKLSGAFLLCARLGSRVRCRELFERSIGKWDLQSKASAS